MQRRAADFVYSFSMKVEAASSLEELEPLLFEAASQLGFSHVACGAHVDPSRPPDGAFLMYNYPAAWADRFIRKQYHLIDPVFRYAETAKNVFSWDDPAFLAGLGERQERVLNEARHYRIVHGYTVPLTNDLYLPASCSFVPESGDVDAWSASVARAIAVPFYYRASLLARGGRAPNIARRLTARERECLTLKAAGAADEEIAKRLSISISTVCRHIEQAKLRLQARTREHAVALAIETRQIR